MQQRQHEEHFGVTVFSYIEAEKETHSFQPTNQARVLLFGAIFGHLPGSGTIIRLHGLPFPWLCFFLKERIILESISCISAFPGTLNFDLFIVQAINYTGHETAVVRL